MDQKVERLEYGLNPLDHSNHSNENVLLTICENSQGSQDVVVQNDEANKFEVRDADGVLQYRFVNPASENNPVNGNLNTQIGNTAEPALQSSNCQYFVISELSTTRPCLITPKTDTPGCTRHLIVNSTKKRDEKRRATHNEVERRRRDKINQWIFRLKDLLPDSSDQKYKNSMGDSKGEILIKACDYIKSMQEQVESLKECLTQNESLQSENTTLKEENRKLREERNELLKLLGKDIKIESEHEVEFDAS